MGFVVPFAVPQCSSLVSLPIHKASVYKEVFVKFIYLHINSKKGTKKKILTFSCNFPTLSVKNEYSASSISRSNSTPFEAASCKYQD